VDPRRTGGHTGAFGAAGADVTTGTRLPQLFAQAGVGTPDGTDVAGSIEPLAAGRIMIDSVFRSLLPTALAHGVITEAEAAGRRRASRGRVSHGQRRG
jgi:hypothetical protein